MKTIFLFVWQGRSNRHLLRTGFLDTLKKYEDLRIVILSPIGEEQWFKEELESTNVRVEKWPRTKIRFWESRLKNLKDYIWVSRCPTRTLRIIRRAAHGRIALIFRDLAGKLARWLGITEELINDWEVKIYQGHPEIRRLYDQYNPDLVIYTRHFASNVHVIKEAKKRDIRCFCLIEGWDNLTSKTAMSVIPDRLIVWNEIMRNEAVGLHRFPADRIDVVGAVPFDPYFYPSQFLPRDVFFKHHGLDPTRQLITYATATEGLARNEIEIVQRLYDAMQAGHFGSPTQLLIRFHPISSEAHRSEYLRRFNGCSDIVIQKPGRWSRLHDGWDPTWADMINLASTMFHSDVVISVFSTIAIDAAVVDTPTICVAFDGKENRPYFRSCRRYADFDHYRNIIKTGGVRVAHDFSGLISDICQCLRNRNLDHEGRSRILKEQCYSQDGQAGYRSAQAVLKELGLSQLVVPGKMSDPEINLQQNLLSVS